VYSVNSGTFHDLVESTLLNGGKSKKKDEDLGDPAEGQADPGSADGVLRTQTHRSTCRGQER
jgi:hypothetical protein